MQVQQLEAWWPGGRGEEMGPGPSSKNDKILWFPRQRQPPPVSSEMEGRTDRRVGGQMKGRKSIVTIRLASQLIQ